MTGEIRQPGKRDFCGAVASVAQAGAPADRLRRAGDRFPHQIAPSTRTGRPWSPEPIHIRGKQQGIGR